MNLEEQKQIIPTKKSSQTKIDEMKKPIPLSLNPSQTKLSNLDAASPFGHERNKLFNDQ